MCQFMAIFYENHTNKAQCFLALPSCSWQLHIYYNANISGTILVNSIHGTITPGARLLEPTAQIWMKIDPYMQRQKRRPMTLVSGNIRYMGIIAGVPVGGGLKWEWGGWRLQFLAIWVATSSETSENKANNIIWRYATPCWPVTDCKMNDLEWPWMAISRETRFLH